VQVARRERDAVKRPERLASQGRQPARGALAEQAKLHTFALGGFSPELLQLAADPAERLHLVAEINMFGGPNAS
jgi:hypothetical protein